MSEANHLSNQNMKQEVAKVATRAGAILDATTTTKNQLNLIKSLVESQVYPIP